MRSRFGKLQLKWRFPTAQVAELTGDQKFCGLLKLIAHNQLYTEAFSSCAEASFPGKQAPEAWSVLGSSPQVP
jgi:hypothetical protein